MARLLSEQIEDLEAAWAEADTDMRAKAREAWAAQGWTICGHPDCPPWNCRVTNP